MCLNVSETDIVQSFQTKEQYKINHQLNCNDKCLIYLFSCKVCDLNSGGLIIKRNDHNDFLEDCSTTLIDKTDGADSARREEYWRRAR